MERDDRFDIMRGVGIILMMLGHIPVEGFAYRWIYSFHMPMFFILSGVFTKNAALFAGGVFAAFQNYQNEYYYRSWQLSVL